MSLLLRFNQNGSRIVFHHQYQQKRMTRVCYITQSCDANSINGTLHAMGNSCFHYSMACIDVIVDIYL